MGGLITYTHAESGSVTTFVWEMRLSFSFQEDTHAISLVQFAPQVDKVLLSPLQYSKGKATQWFPPKKYSEFVNQLEDIIRTCKGLLFRMPGGKWTERVPMEYPLPEESSRNDLPVIETFQFSPFKTCLLPPSCKSKTRTPILFFDDMGR
jgi:hypothetical protein